MSIFATEVKQPLDFKPAAIPEALGVEAWQAQRGSFVFTVAHHPDFADGYSVAISFRDDYLPKGPAETLEEAFALCNRALLSLNL